MKVEKQGGYWVASGNGLTRPIVVESGTRLGAIRAYLEALNAQKGVVWS